MKPKSKHPCLIFPLLLINGMLTVGVLAQPPEQFRLPVQQWLKQSAAKATRLQSKLQHHRHLHDKKWTKLERKMDVAFNQKKDTKDPAINMVEPSGINLPFNPQPTDFKQPYDALLDTLNTFYRMLNAEQGSSGLNPSAVLPLKNTMEEAAAYRREVEDRFRQWKQKLSTASGINNRVKNRLARMHTLVQDTRSVSRQVHDVIHTPDALEKQILSWLSRHTPFGNFFASQSDMAARFGQATPAGISHSMNVFQSSEDISRTLLQKMGQYADASASDLQQRAAHITSMIAAGRAAMSEGQTSGSPSRSDDISGHSQAPASAADEFDSKSDGDAEKPQKRFQLGFNFQPQRYRRGFPATNDLGISLGMHVGKSFTAGIGMAYSFGLGSLQKIQFTHEGIVLRMFMDHRISNTWFFSGSFEMNHQARFRTLPSLYGSTWQPGALAGLMKQVKTSKASFTVQAMLDVYSMLARHGTAPLCIRWGRTL